MDKRIKWYNYPGNPRGIVNKIDKVFCTDAIPLADN